MKSFENCAQTYSYEKISRFDADPICFRVYAQLIVARRECTNDSWSVGSLWAIHYETHGASSGVERGLSLTNENK